MSGVWQMSQNQPPKRRMIINNAYTLGGEKCIENTLNCVIDGELMVQTWGEEFTISHLAGSVITLQIPHVKSKNVIFSGLSASLLSWWGDDAM